MKYFVIIASFLLVFGFTNVAEAIYHADRVVDEEKREEAEQIRAERVETMEERAENIEERVENVEVRTEERTERIEERRIKLEERRLDRVNELVDRIFNSFKTVSDRFGNVSDKLSTKIDQLEERGLDMEGAKVLLEEADAQLAVTLDMIVSAQQNLEEALDGEITRGTIKDVVSAVRESIKETHAAYKAVIQEIKDGIGKAISDRESNGGEEKDDDEEEVEVEDEE